MASTMPPSRISRIPVALQGVFLASNRGNEMNDAPPDNVASKVFVENAWMQRSTDPSAQKPSTTKSQSKRSKLSVPSRSMVVLEDVEEEGEETCLVVQDASEHIPLQKYLDDELDSRGYSTRTFEPLYHQKPSPLQLASYSTNLIGFVRENRLDEFRIIVASGISPNPCNKFGESLLHTVCRRGDTAFLQVLLDHGASVKVADDYGRTPLHDACWAPKPSFSTVKLLMDRDPHLFFMSDARGHRPLHYVRKQDWGAWKSFLAKHWDVYWPRGKSHGMPQPQFSLPDPENALQLELAELVVAGRMEPEEAAFLNPSCLDFDDEYAMSDYDDSSYDDDESSCYSEESWAEPLMGSIAYGHYDQNPDESWETHVSFMQSVVVDEDDSSCSESDSSCSSDSSEEDY